MIDVSRQRQQQEQGSRQLADGIHIHQRAQPFGQGKQSISKGRSPLATAENGQISRKINTNQHKFHGKSTNFTPYRPTIGRRSRPDDGRSAEFSRRTSTDGRKRPNFKSNLIGNRPEFSNFGKCTISEKRPFWPKFQVKLLRTRPYRFRIFVAAENRILAGFSRPKTSNFRRFFTPQNAGKRWPIQLSFYRNALDFGTNFRGIFRRFFGPKTPVFRRILGRNFSNFSELVPHPG